MIRSMKKERLRDISLCRNGFEAFERHYPFMCKFQTAKLYPQPRIAKNWPSEIVPRRLYLGD